jgi:glycosyltransferase involved in cell wall biosynthesis
MVLVNVHPDYMCFPGEAPSRRTYPAQHYVALLEYIRDRYAGKYWQALPREVASFTARSDQPRLLRKVRRVAMVTHSFYENDNRVTRYAEALAAQGDHVDVVSLRRNADAPKHEIIEGVNVHRIQDRFGKTEQSKLSFLLPILRFLWNSSRWLTDRHSRQSYDLLHIHNMPDFLVYAGWYPRMTGARIILDIHDIVPEFYSSKFAGGKVSLAARTLQLIERHAAHFADHVIISNHLWYEKYTARTDTTDKCSVYINNVDTKIFQAHPRTRTDDHLIVIFPGGLQWHQGLDIALRAFVRVSQTIPGIEFHIYGDGNMKPSLIELTRELGLTEKVRFFDPVGVRQVAQVMSNADLGVVPKRADSFGNEAYSTKIMEFMSLGVPVVVSKTKIDRYYFNDSVVRFFDSGDPEALADGMIEVLSNTEQRQRMIAHASAYAELHSWNSRRQDYLQLVDELITQGTARPVLATPQEVAVAASPGEIAT